MTCSRCQLPGSAITPADRRCSFDAHGLFRSGGLHCGTISALQALVRPDGKETTAGMEGVMVAGAGAIIVLGWIGRGSHVEFARVQRKLSSTAIASEPLTLEMAEEVIAARTPLARRA